MSPYIFPVTLYDVALLAAIFISACLTWQLLFTTKLHLVTNRFLALILAVISLWLIRTAGRDMRLHCGNLPLQFTLALGPLIYFYVRQITQPGSGFSPKDWLHFSPLLPEIIGRLYQLNTFFGLLTFISVAIYLVLSHQLIRLFYRRLHFQGGDRSRGAVRWLSRWLSVFSLLWLSGIAFIGPGGANLWYILVAAMAIRLAAMALVRQGLAKPTVSRLTGAAGLKAKGTWLKSIMKVNRYYLDPGLTLSSLAEKLELTTHELSQIINQALKKSFNDFINEYRVAEVGRRMQDASYKHLTLQGIAYESGFNSKTTFHRLFKQMTGKSPAGHKASLKKELPSYSLEPRPRHDAVISHQQKSNRSVMFQNYVKIAWRNIRRNKVYTTLNVAGLSIGIAACLLIFVIVHYELSYDTYQPDYENIYHVVTRIHQTDGFTYSPGTADPASAALRLDFPQAKVAALESNYGGQVIVPAGKGNAAGDKKFIEYTGMVFIEPQFFDIFKWNWLAGNPAVLNDPGMVVLSKSTAMKYFGRWDNAEGKIIKMDNLLTLKVGGIVEDAPGNTDLPLRVMVSYATWKDKSNDYGYSTNWNSNSPYHQVFMSLPSNADVDKVNAQLVAFSKKYFTNRTGQTYTLFLQPLADLHFDTRFDNTFGDHITSMANLRTLGLIGLLIILMAAINFINLSTAQSVGRSKEVGIRKVLGSSRLQLILQVIGETAMIVFGSVLLAVAIAELALPYLKNIATVPADISLLNPGTLVFLVGATFAIILLSGLYPALVVSAFKPVLALKNKITAATVGGIPLRRALVVAQFAISQLLIIGTIAAVSQISFINSADLGFDKNAVMIIFGPSGSSALQRMKSVKQQLLENPQVSSASLVTDAPSSSIEWAANFSFNNVATPVDFQANLKEGDADYFKTFGFHFDAGRGYDHGDSTRQVVINETMVHRLGFQHPQDIIGKTIRLGGTRWSSISGVVRDFKAKSLRETVRPMIIFPNDKFALEMAVKIKTTNIRRTVASIQKTWEGIYPEFACSYYFVDADIALFYKQDNQLALIYKIFAGLAIFISCLGLYGLVSFMALQRTREVGIRKVLGASVSSIVCLFSKEFMLLIILSFFIAAPVAWYFVHSWLQGFAYRINLSVWIFVMAAAASIIIAWLTVGYKSVKAALATPVKSLRSE